MLLPFLSFLGGKIGKSKVNLLYVESDFKSVPKANHANHSQTSPVEELNFIVESKSLPFELNNLIIEFYFPSTRKKSLQSYCSVDFDFLALIDFM